MIDRIAIIGTGLIGGSLGLAWRRHNSDLTIIGHDRPEVLEKAEERDAITAKAADPARAVENADLVVLATPTRTILRMLEQIAPHLSPGTFVTDVASVKTPVLEQAHDVLPDEVAFLGGHPMAGSEEQGIDHASPLLFENAAYALCPLNGDAEALGPYEPVVDCIEAVGARPLVIDAASHDRIAATVSHVPQLLAVALVNAAGELDSDDEPVLQLAAGGFRDMTRIASSPFDMWRDILVGNQGAVLDAIGRLMRSFRSIRNRVAMEEWEDLGELFDQAHDLRANIPTDTKGFLQPLADVFVEAEDQPGVLHRMTGALYDADLNVKDIELLKFREGTGGTFRLSFESEAAASEAVDVLNAADYPAHRP